MRFDLETVDVDKLGGGDFPPPGSYHLEVLEFCEEDPRNGACWMDSEVLAGSVKGQEGKVHREYFATTEKAQGRLLQLAVAMKITTEEELKRLKAAGESPEIDFKQLAPGRQFCGKLVLEEYKGKTRCKLNFNIWAVDDPKAKGIPLDQGRVAEFRRMLESGQAGPFGDVPDEKSPAAGEPPSLAEEAADLF